MKIETFMWPDFGKPTKLLHLVFREIPILNIQATVVPLCWIVATPVILYNWNSLLASLHCWIFSNFFQNHCNITDGTL